MSSNTKEICKRIVELLATVTFSVPIVPKVEDEPTYDVTDLDDKVHVILTPKDRERDPAARGLTLVEHKVTMAVLAALKPKSPYSTADLEGLQEELEDWADECDLDRPEALTGIDVLAIYSPTKSKQENLFLSGVQLTFIGGHSV